MGFLITLALIVGSCKDDWTSLPVESAFSLKLEVVDTAGHPSPGLRISVWNRLDGIYPGMAAKTAGPTGLSSISSMMFDVPNEARISLTVFDLDGAVVTSLYDRELLEAGFHIINFSIQASVPTRVYKCLYVAEDTAGSTVLFRDSIFAVLWQPDVSISILGWTSSPAGTFETRDSLLFPNTLALPPLIETGQDPSPIGTFTISDNVTIVLTDTARHQYQSFQRVIRKGIGNTIQLVWNPRAAAMESTHPIKPSRRQVNTDGVVVPGDIPRAFKLHQNFPNPFN